MFLLDAWFRPFRETHRVKVCDRNVSLFLIIRRKMAHPILDQKKFIVESMIKTNSNVTTRRQFKKIFGLDVPMRIV